MPLTKFQRFSKTLCPILIIFKLRIARPEEDAETLAAIRRLKALPAEEPDQQVEVGVLDC